MKYSTTKSQILEFLKENRPLKCQHALNLDENSPFTSEDFFQIFKVLFYYNFLIDLSILIENMAKDAKIGENLSDFDPENEVIKNSFSLIRHSFKINQEKMHTLRQNFPVLFMEIEHCLDLTDYEFSSQRISEFIIQSENISMSPSLYEIASLKVLSCTLEFTGGYVSDDPRRKKKKILFEEIKRCSDEILKKLESDDKKTFEDAQIYFKGLTAFLP